MHIGIVGCGQLARMLALAGWPMGMTFSFLASPEENICCVKGLGNVVRLTNSSDAGALYDEMGRPDVITIEREAVDVALLKAFTRYCPVAPDPDIAGICQHRALEKNFLNAAGVPTVPFVHIKGKDQLSDACKALGFPVIVKTSKFGYDGLNQWRLNSPDELESQNLPETALEDAVVEQRVAFTRELSIISARSSSGERVSFMPSENWHRHGTLLASVAPIGNLADSIADQLREIVRMIFDKWNYVGVLAVECFDLDGKILVNELAPRVHNSGHWTQQGCATSQFENHLRAIAGMTLGSTQSYGYSAMINLLGREASEALRSNPLAHIHLYNKALRPGRKMGHVNLLCTERAQLRTELTLALESLYPEALGQVA